MSRSVDRLRQRNQGYKEAIYAFDAIQGDGADAASMIGPGIAELASGAQKFAQAEKEKSDAQKKAAADKAAYEKSDEFAAKKAAEQARKNADDLSLKAQTLRAKAGVTKSPADVKAADDAEKLAALADIDAREAEAKYARFHPAGAGGADASRSLRSGFVFPTWGKIALGVLGVGVVGLVGYKILKRKG